MPAKPQILPVDIERLRAAPWLRTPAIRQVFAALATTGAVSRAVGGAVRNTLLGHAIDDVDIATAATPEQVLAAARRAGLKAVPTGLDHGTVTLVVDGSTFEVTTLRRDVETDGRHATVAYTGDWTLDASRRDFTINALYCDPDGTLFDPLGGAVDLVPPRVRFIGDARARIREDYLRILRFFRFSARYAEGPLDADGLAACAAERDGLTRVSAERVRVELLKLLVSPRAADVCRIMQAHGFLVSLLGAAPSPGRLQRLAAIERTAGFAPDAVVRLAALAVYPASDVVSLARRLRLSGAERERLERIAAGWAAVEQSIAPTADRRALYRLGVAAYRDVLLAAWAGSLASPDDAGWLDRLRLPDRWNPPRFPLTGEDVLALGVAAGPLVGRLLGAVEGWWLDQDFNPDSAACLAELAARAKP